MSFFFCKARLLKMPRMNQQEKRALFHALFFPSIFIIAIWLIKIIELASGTRFAEFGIDPGTLKGIIGVFLAPLIHSDFNHLINNSIPLFVLSAAVFYLYRPLHYKVFFIIYLISGFMVWAIARTGIHIGASGIVYGLVSFVFLSGLIRKDTGLMALSGFTVMFYGSMVWGILPIDYTISWESHLFGALTGLFCAVYYRKEGPQRKLFDWEYLQDTIEDAPDSPDAYWMNPEEEITNSSNNTNIIG